MNWKILKNDEDYNSASMRLMEIFHSIKNSIEEKELIVLIALVEEYDNKHFQLDS